MTPAEQGQERWTIKVCRECGYESLVRSNPQESALGHAVHAGKDGEVAVEEVEVVPASDKQALEKELELCQTYFPFMRRDRDYYKAKAGALREAARGILGDYEPPDNSRGLDAFMGPVAEVAEQLTAGKLNNLYAALDQSGKEARR